MTESDTTCTEVSLMQQQFHHIAGDQDVDVAHVVFDTGVNLTNKGQKRSSAILEYGRQSSTEQSLTLGSIGTLPSLESNFSILSVAAVLVGSARSVKDEPTDEHAHNLWMLAYTWSVALMVIVVGYIYWSDGVEAIVRILVYLFSLSTIKVANKILYDTFGFQFPKFLGAAHLLCSAIVGLSLVLYRTSEIKVPTCSEFWRLLLPLSAGFSYSLGASNTALLFCTAAFTEIVSATTPIVSVAMLVVMRVEFPLSLVLPVLVMILGTICAIKGELAFSLFGFILCLLANVGRSVKVVWQQITLTGDAREKYDPGTLLFWQCIISFVVMLVWSFCTEGVSPYMHMATEPRLHDMLVALLISSAIATLLNFSHILVIQNLGAVGIQMVAQMKGVLTIMGSLAILEERVTPLEMVGFVLVMTGCWWYARMDQKIKEVKRKAESAALEVAPDPRGR